MRETARERFTNAIARLLHRSYAEGLTVQEADDIRDAASQAKRIYEAERERAERAEREREESRAEIDGIRFAVSTMKREHAECRAERDTLRRERDEARERIPYPWCHECQAECQRVDEDGLCLACGTEPEFPTALTVRDRAVLRAECQAGRACEDDRETPFRETMARYQAARQQTDAAGAMGDTEVGR